MKLRTLLNGWRLLESISLDISQKNRAFPKHDTVSNIVGAAKIAPVKKSFKNFMRKILIESSVSKSVAKGDSPQAFFV